MSDVANRRKIQMIRRRKDRLIPIEKAKRVIYLDKRGRFQNMSVISIILMALGILCLLYCVGIFLFMGYGTSFFLIWGVAGVFLTGLGYLTSRRQLLEKIPHWLKLTAGIVFGISILIFILTECMILSKFWSKPPAGADYCIVLGAQLKSHGPSDVLRRRLDAAVSYLEENENTNVYVSGGQGANEPMTEAQGMYDYLVARGIAPERIFQEDTSVNTFQNLKNTGEMIDKQQDTVVIVTNNFHVFRAMGIAEKMGYDNVYGLAADSYPGMLPNNMLREFLGVVKDLLVGNM